MKKLLLILPLVVLLLMGASCTDQDDQTGDTSELKAEKFELGQGQTLLNLSDGWDSVVDESAEQEAVGQEETLDEDEWKGDPAQVLKEIYFSGPVSGQVMNQAHHLENLGATLKGIMVVYQDGSIGGTGTITYNDANRVCKIDMGTEGVIECKYAGVTDGTFNLTGEIVDSEQACDYSEEWLGNENYRFKTFFSSDQNPTEKISYINNISGLIQDLDNYELHQILHAGLFGRSHMICPILYDPQTLNLSSSQASGEFTIEFTDDFGQFQDLRETMGLTVQ